jgi:hypothetical protein
MVEEASGIWPLNRKRQIGYTDGLRSEIDRLISVRQGVTLYTNEPGEETNGAVRLGVAYFARCLRHF